MDWNRLAGRSPGMISSMKKVASAVIIIAALLAGCVIDENRPSQVVLAPQAATTAAQYHYTGKYCSDCHEPIPQEGGPKFLKFSGDFNQLCKCHAPANYVHPVDIAPSRLLKAKIPAALPLQQGKITCLTCHDIYWQCRQRRVDKNSLRGRPFPRRSDFCYQCHDKASYKMLDIHTQLNADGKLMVETCLYCHTAKPDENRARYEDVKFIGDLEMMCQRCHAIQGNHAGNFNHLVKPSAKALARMQTMEKKFGIVLPLDKNGQLTCITCHNPHDKGVIRAESPAARGAGSKHRQRLPGRLCIECHQI
jgi:hypothetical protein